jgi:hypothetical protein
MMATFLASGVLAGFLNYLFQIVTKRHLPEADFSEFTGWFADLSVFFLLGGLFQNFACFRPSARRQTRLSLILINAFFIASVLVWIALPGVLTADRAVLILCASCCLGWLLGQVQIRLAFSVLAAVNVVMAGFKLAFTQLPYGAPEAMDRYALAMFANFLPAIWLMSAFLWRAPDAQRNEGKESWSPAVVLSIAAAVIPIYDLAILHHSISAAEYVEFATASLFFRPIYFLVALLAQWLLPRQILKQTLDAVYAPSVLLAAAVLGGLALSAFAPFIATYFLNSTPPARTLVFMSCLHTSLLAMLLLQIQACAAGHRLAAARWTLAVLGLEAAVQLTLQMESVSYLAFVIFCQSGLMIYHLHHGPPTSEQTLNIAA